MSFLHTTHIKNGTGGFTIIELIVSVSIFTFLTAFLVVKYGTFNSSVLLTNMAYDVALTLRNAQTYGLNVKSKPTDDAAFTDGTYADIASGYQYAYGVNFFANTSGSPASRKITFYADNGDPEYDSESQKLAEYALKYGYISEICPKKSETLGCEPVLNNQLEIWFKRPNPEAGIGPVNSGFTYVEFTLSSNSGETRKVVVRKTGQIAILK